MVPSTKTTHTKPTVICVSTKRLLGPVRREESAEQPQRTQHRQQRHEDQLQVRCVYAPEILCPTAPASFEPACVHDDVRDSTVAYKNGVVARLKIKNGATE